MGYEYRVSCDNQILHLFDKFIRIQPFFVSYNTESKSYNLRVEPKANDDWPDVSVYIETDSFLLECHARDKNSSWIFYRIIDWALSHSPEKITIEEP